MYEITFHCEVISPLFLYGADGRTPELRSLSLKGALRFWWRAMQGKMSIQELKRKEIEFFGGSERNDDESVKSPVIISIDAEKKVIENCLKQNEDLQWKYNIEKKTITGEHFGIGYLYYSVADKRPYFKSQSTFRICFNSCNKAALIQFISSFWAVVFLGGIGSRNRRGGGNISIKKIFDPCAILEKIKLEFIPDEKMTPAKWLTYNFKIAKNIVLNECTDGFIDSYTNLSVSRFIISKELFDTWINALNDVGKIFCAFRAKNKSNIFGSAVFGLPIKHKSGKITSKNVNRRSSPLIFKIVQRGRQYHWMVLRLSGEYLPTGEVLSNLIRSAKPEYKLIDIFWHELQKSGIESILSIPDSLQKLVNLIKTDSAVSKVILFGSKARGDFNVKSDIDLAVKTDKPLSSININGAIDLIDMNKANDELLETIYREGIEL